MRVHPVTIAGAAGGALVGRQLAPRRSRMLATIAGAVGGYMVAGMARGGMQIPMISLHDAGAAQSAAEAASVQPPIG